MDKLSFEPSEKRYRTSALPMFCYKIKSGTVSDKLATVTPNWHNEIEIICSEAPITLFVSDKRYDLEPWDVFFINPREIHLAFRRGEGPIRSIVFDLALLKTPSENDKYNQLIDDIIEGRKKFVARPNRESELYREMTSFFGIVDKCAYVSFKNGADKYMMLSGLYSMMAKCIEDNFFEDAPVEKRGGMNYVNEIIDYIDAHYDEPITASVLAKEFNISKPYVYSLFKKFVGITPLQYLNSTRLKEAYRLLSEGASVTDCALAIGFSDVSYFIKFFKDATGRTPLRWKERNTNKQ